MSTSQELVCDLPSRNLQGLWHFERYSEMKHLLSQVNLSAKILHNTYGFKAGLQSFMQFKAG